MIYTIQYLDGPKEVEGEAIGPYLTVRKNTYYIEENWVIDHVPTGLKIAGSFPSEQAARTVAQSIQDKADWGKVTKDTTAEENRKWVTDEVIQYLRAVSRKTRVWPFGAEPTKPPDVQVELEISGTYSFSAEDLWPDGDWPDKIDSEAVKRLIKDEGGIHQVLKEWNLEDGLDHEVRVFERTAR